MNCGSQSFTEPKLQEICAELMGTDGFDEQKFNEAVNSITVLDGGDVQMQFKGGETKITQNGKNISNSTLCLIESSIHTPIAVMLINHKNPLLSLIAILYRVYIKYINTKGENTAANTAIESKKYPLGLPLASKPFR